MAQSVYSRNSLDGISAIKENGKIINLGVVKSLRANKSLNSFIPENSKLSASWVRLKKDEKLHVHTHPIDCLYIITEGEATLLGELQGQVVSSGDIITIPAGSHHGFVGSGEKGYWALSIQFEQRGLYDDPSKPLAQFSNNESDYCEKILRRNKEFAQAFRSNLIFPLLNRKNITEEFTEAFLSILQILSNHFQKMMLLRSGLSEQEEYSNLFFKHLHEEFGHNELLKSTRKSTHTFWDAQYEAICCWFSYQMMTLDNIEKLFLVNFIIEESASIFYTTISPIFRKFNIKHLQEHSTLDEEHSNMGISMLQQIDKKTFDNLCSLQSEAWNMVNCQYERMAHILEDLS